MTKEEVGKEKGRKRERQKGLLGTRDDKLPYYKLFHIPLFPFLYHFDGKAWHGMRWNELGI